MPLLSMLIFILLMVTVWLEMGSVAVFQWQLLTPGLPSVEILLVLDHFSLLFSLTVIIIFMAVMFFSVDYMKNDLFANRFHFTLMVFVLSMLLLIFTPNLVTMLWGWDGLGVSSYLLVTYYDNSKSFNAGMLTALTNRLGDALLLMMVGLLFIKGSWIFSLHSFNFNKYRSMMILLIVAASTKSAQLPFSAWLPAAMAAPTPVSALVHSSTLVTAGIYIMIRHLMLCNLKTSPWLFFSFLMISITTMTLASLAAMNEKDMKKMIALSTLSQLGIMMVSISMGLYWLSFTHLLIHAYFKAMMFIVVGDLIHGFKLYQSMMKSGSIYFSSSINSSTALTSSLGLSGAPFAAAYFSKEPIIEMMMVDSFSFMEFWVMIFSVVLTLAYSFRFIYMVMMKWSSQETSNVYYENFWVNLATGILFVPSFSSGALLNSTMVVYPTFFMNSNYLKMIILLIIVLIPLVTIFFSLLGKSYLISYEYSLWAMFSMTLFSGKLWKPVVFTMGKWVSVANKSFVLKFLTFMKSSQLNLTTAYKFESSILYRLISPIVLIFIVGFIFK